jgi:peroxisomal 3,2-trans-enoyl-CoA isomerase
MSDVIKYEVRDRTTVITINNPSKYGALDFDGYQALDEAVQKAAKEPNTVATLIVGTGKFFSAGADVTGGRAAPIDLGDAETEYAGFRRHYLGQFAARNLGLTDTFWTHPKVLIAALNGPVIGLSAALVALCDLIYAIDTTYLLLPFANIGLVTEGASAYSITRRLGLSKASEALLCSRPIPAEDLRNVGFLNKLYKKNEFASTEEFNAHIEKLVAEYLYGLVPQSVLEIKQLMKRSMTADANAAEVIGGLEKFANCIPQNRFAQLAQKSLRHKL